MTAGPRLSLGWVSAVVVSTLIGLGLVGTADVKALHGGNIASNVNLFFVGILLIFSPNAMRILMRKTARMERFILVILLGVAFYAIKILASPHAFIYNDEYIHLRNTQNILAGGHLFQFNPLLPTAGYYPGLAAITATLVNLTGFSVFLSGLIVIGVARVVISASFYFVAERVTGSSRGGGVASLLYATNSMFLFWSAQFAYEDLALPLAAFTVWWLTRTRNIRGRTAAQIITVITIIAVTVTHHISAFALCAILAALYIAERTLGYPTATRRYLGVFAALAGVLAACWFFVVAKPAATYLVGQNFTPAMQGMASTFTGQGSGRTLYGGSAETPPKWYIYIGFLALLIILGALLPAVIRAWRILRTRGFANSMRPRASVAVATIIAISFPLTLLPRLTPEGSAISARTSELIFTAIGCTVGLLWEEAGRSASLGTQRIPSLAPWNKIRTLVATFLASLVLIGQVSIGTSFFTILPATTAGFPVYVQPYMISAAEWSNRHLGADQVFATDNINTLALTGYGQEDPMDVNYIWPIFYTTDMNSMVIGMIKKYHIDYVLLDLLTTEEQPVKPGGFYYSSLEPINSINGGPLPKAYLGKFAAYTCSRLIYKSGSIRIYDISQIANGSCIPHRITNAPKTSGKKSANLKAAS
jgi:hypothetical protein